MSHSRETHLKPGRWRVKLGVLLSQREISIDQYREVYDAARKARDGQHAGGYDDADSGGYHGGMVVGDEEGPLVDTIRLTVKPPSIAIR